MSYSETEVSTAEVTAADEVVNICRDLLRIKTTNKGNNDSVGERAAAEMVAGLLDEVGIDSSIYESQPGRSSLVAHWGPSEGEPLLIHGHLDVVPADATQWRFDPFAGEIADGMLWGRGAVDMKDFDAIVLAVVRARQRASRLPSRPVVLCFTGDEEAGGKYGAGHLVRHHQDHFVGCREAVSEVGGFSVTVRNRRIYLIQAAEKGLAWMKVTSSGTAGHGSMRNGDNSVTALARAVARVGEYQWPVRLTEPMRVLLATVGELTGTEPTPANAEALVAEFGPAARMLGAVISNTLNPTMMDAGYKTNVVPGEAVAHLDGRTLPGYEDEFYATLSELLGPDLRVDYEQQMPPLTYPFSGKVVEAINTSLLAHDPDALVAPYLMSGGTDSKHFDRLGIRSYGFAPLKLPADLDFTGLFHGVDERVPLDSLRFGTVVFDDFLDRI